MPPSQRQNSLVESFQHIANSNYRDAPVVTMFSGGLDSDFQVHVTRCTALTRTHQEVSGGLGDFAPPPCHIS